MINTNEQRRVDVRLSQEELTFLMRALGFPSLPGFTPSAIFTEEQGSAAARGLIARAFIDIREEKMIIDERLAAVIATGGNRYPSHAAHN